MGISGLHARLCVTLATVVLAVGAARVRGQSAVHVAPNAPVDRPHGVTSDTAMARVLAAMQPWVDSARATYPAARDRYLRGLPEGQSFFVTARLVDDEGRMEQVFVAVDSIVGTKIHGRIWSRVRLVRGFALRQDVWLWERELVDWLITRPDGSEEGNFVGKLLDTYDGEG